MEFIRIRSQIQNLPAFNLSDLRKIDPNFYKRQLMDWIKRGYIKPLAGEYYLLSDATISEDRLLMFANTLYKPSYISLESALAYYSVIPETVQGITSVSSKKTKEYESDWGVFSYRSIKPVLMLGFEIVEGRDQIKYLIARLEKAVLDYLYLNSHVNSIQDFEGMRWNKQNLAGLEANERFQRYCKIFNKKALDQRVAALMEYINA